MTVDEIFENWNVDCKIDQLDLGNAALQIPKLHNKYLHFLSNEKRDLRKLEKQLKKFRLLKTEYFSGQLNGTDELKKLGWEPYQKVLLKNVISEYVDSEDDVQKLSLMVEEQRDKVETLEFILKEILSRNFIIKSAIDWRKFTEGIN